MKITRTILQVVITIIVAGIILAAFAFIGMGIYILLQSFYHLADPATRQQALLAMLEAVDVFLIALVFLILAIGLAQLFLGKSLAGNEPYANWLHFDDFTELKLVLWKTVLTTLLIAFFVELYKAREHPSVELLIFPGSMLLVALSFFLLKSKHQPGKDNHHV